MSYPSIHWHKHIPTDNTYHTSWRHNFLGCPGNFRLLCGTLEMCVSPVKVPWWYLKCDVITQRKTTNVLQRKLSILVKDKTKRRETREKFMRSRRRLEVCGWSSHMEESSRLVCTQELPEYYIIQTFWDGVKIQLQASSFCWMLYDMHN